MINVIQDILKTIDSVSAWKINERSVISEELFFIKKKLDMNRSKSVHDYSVTVYVDFEEEDKKYRGSSKATISPSMNENEIKTILEDAAFAASFVKNKRFELVKPCKEQPENLESNLSQHAISKWMPLITKALYEEDMQNSNGINSCEIFLNQFKRRIVNSEGVDITYDHYVGEIELITEWNEGNEAVELFSIFNFSEYQPEILKEKVREMLGESRERALAKLTPTLKGISVILSGEAVKNFLEFYVLRASAQAIYEETSGFKIGQKLQGETVIGDFLNIELLPMIKNSTESRPYDENGQLLKPLRLIEDGVLKAYHGALQYTSYLGVEPTGILSNIKVSCGEKSIDVLKAEPYIQLLSFSDFQMDDFTGDFGGEIRLARYFDGVVTIPVAGGSISGNIFDVHHHLSLSKETTQYNNYIGPKSIKLPKMEILGQ